MTRYKVARFVSKVGGVSFIAAGSIPQLPWGESVKALAFACVAAWVFFEGLEFGEDVSTDEPRPEYRAS